MLSAIADRSLSSQTIKVLKYLDCSHKDLVCLNHYETFRKYLCHDCGQVFICECEKKLGLEFLPYQLTLGTEYGTQKRYPVSAFAPNICATCRGPPATSAIQRYQYTTSKIKLVTEITAT